MQVLFLESLVDGRFGSSTIMRKAFVSFSSIDLSAHLSLISTGILLTFFGKINSLLKGTKSSLAVALLLYVFRIGSYLESSEVLILTFVSMRGPLLR